MNIERKYNAQLRKIEILENQIKKLQEENANLLSNNKSLKDKIDSYESYIENIQDIKNELFQSISEAKEIRKNYEDAIKDAHKTKSKYMTKMRFLLGKLRVKFRI